MSDLPVPLYQSNDGDALDAHIEQANNVGIDVLLCIWRGPDDDESDDSCRRLLRRVGESGYDMQTVFLVDLSDEAPGKLRTREGLMSALNELKQDILYQDAYMKFQGKPAVFWLNPNYFGSVEDWQRFRNQVDLNRDMFWFVSTDIPSFQDDIYSYLNVFDAAYMYDITRQTVPINALNAYASNLQQYNRSHGAQKPFIATVMPGHDDTRINPNGHYRDRQNGTYYRSSWAAAAQYRPAAVFLNSFNGFYEGTHIQPSEVYGTQYLDLTAEMIQNFRSIVPSRSLSQQGGPAPVYFPQTGHFLKGAFRSYWERKGREATFGYPVTEEFIRKSDGKLVQYFERARLELRVVDDVAHIDLGLIGSEYAKLKGYTFEPIAPVPNTSLQQYFPETGHSTSGWFKLYWEQHGGRDFFGYPISEIITEQFPDGVSRRVQYFERGRLEEHGQGNIQVGLLGTAIAPCHHLEPRAADNPPEAPLEQGDDDPCMEISDLEDETPFESKSEIPGYTVGQNARGRVYPTVVQPGQVQGFEAWDFKPNEEVVLWLNKPDLSVRVLDYRAVADENGYVLIGFQTRRTDDEGQWSLVGQGVESGREVVATFELRW
jgi:hypothetical protein